MLGNTFAKSCVDIGCSTEGICAGSLSDILITPFKFTEPLAANCRLPFAVGIKVKLLLLVKSPPNAATLKVPGNK